MADCCRALLALGHDRGSGGGESVSVHIVGCRGLNQDTYADCLHPIPDGENSLVVDLRAVEFIDGYSVIELLCAMHQLSRTSAAIRLLPPHGALRGYLTGMRFFELMPDVVAYSGSRLSREPTSDQLIPVSRLDMADGEYGIEALANFVYPLLPLDVAVTFTDAFAEIASNVIHHAEAEDAFVSGQRLDIEYRGRPPPRLHLVVGDTGIGIKASLAEALPEVASLSDAEAIERALQPGVTGKPGKNSGVGLYTVRETVTAFDGELRIRSGSWSVVWHRRGSQRYRTPRLGGTVVSAELPTSSKRGGRV